MNGVNPGAAPIAAPYLNCNPTREAELAVRGPGVAGRFESVELVHACTGLVVERYAFDNLITDRGLDRIGSDVRLESVVAYCAVGSGSSTPATTNTSLDAELGRTNDNGGFGTTTATGPSYSYFESRVTRIFSTAQANGVVAEVGFLDAATGGNLWCRQLIRDASGNATTISKTSEFQLRVVYAYRVYTSPDVATTTVAVNGVDQTVRSRHVETAGFPWSYMPTEMGGLWGYNGAVASDAPALPDTPQGYVPWTRAVNQTSLNIQPYVAGTHYRDVEYTWTADRANFPISVVRFDNLAGGRGMGASQFTVPIQKTDTQKLVILARFPWARVTL